MTDALQPSPTCPVCRSSKTSRIDASSRKAPMLFCGMCGHMWPADAPPPAKKRGSVFEIPPDD
jgi:transcription elongation factor Elf1